MLPIQRQVISELVDHHPGDEAHVGPAAIDYPYRGRWTRQRQAIPTLDHATDVLEHHVTAWPLREPVANLLADDLVLIRAQCRDFWAQYLDHLDRHPRFVEEQRRLVGVLGRLLRLALAFVTRNTGLLGRRCLIRNRREVLTE